jgi:aspartyl-tRNA(Asn)/glutamyl-tRNA(Gln) amidotransferase subunit C
VPNQTQPTAAAGISRQEVAHLARLARLAVTEPELDTFAGQLDVILHAVARVGEVTAADIPPTSHAVPLTNVLREDQVSPGLPRADALAGAPDPAQGRFRVPRILDLEE